MCVLLGFREVQLADTVFGQGLGERLVDLLFGEHDRCVEIGPVLRHRRDVCACLYQLRRQLTGPVGTEVEEDGGVSFEVEARGPLDDDRLDELICDASLVTTPDRVDWILRLFAFAGDDRVECALGAVPALVPVHCVIAPDHRRDSLSGQLGKVCTPRREERRRDRR